MYYQRVSQSDHQGDATQYAQTSYQIREFLCLLFLPAHFWETKDLPKIQDLNFIEKAIVH